MHTPAVRWPNAKNRNFRSLLADLGHFLTSDVILKENFCRLASIWLIGLMKLFALGRIVSAGSVYFRLSWRGRKVHRNGDYNAAHFEFCRRRVTPSGPPSALTSRRWGRTLTVTALVVIVVVVVACVVRVVYCRCCLLFRLDVRVVVFVHFD